MTARAHTDTDRATTAGPPSPAQWAPRAVGRVFEDARIPWIAALLIATAAAFGAPPAVFTVDEVFYIQMAAAMAGEGRLVFEQMHLDGAPSVSLAYAVPTSDGRLAPHYPPGYALIVAPFHLLFGLRGLILANALAGVANVWLIRRIALATGAARLEASGAALLFAFASLASTYYLAIWPHQLALVFVLGGVLLLLRATAAAARQPRLVSALAPAFAAGLAFGFGLTVRVDVFLAAIAGIVWLRMVVGGPTRLLSAVFLSGLAPGLLLAAAANAVKFGVFHPFSYNSSGGGTDFGRYAPILAAIGVLLAVSFVFDAAALRARATRFLRGAPDFVASRAAAAIGVLIAGLCVGAVLWANTAIAGLFKNFAVLLVDFNFHAFEGSSVSRDEFGLVRFFGLPKKALLQSMPFLPVAVIALWRFCTGAGRRGEALLWLTVGAFLTFYALTRWHGGLSLNMRYYLPAAALLCPLSAAAIGALAQAARLELKPLFYAGAIAMAAFVIIFVETIGGGRWDGVAQLYPQLALAGALLIGALFYIARPSAFAARAALLCVAAAVGASLVVNAGDALRDRWVRDATLAHETAYGAFLPDGALVFSSSPHRYAGLMRERLSVVYPGVGDERSARAAAAAFLAAGRCVYAEGEAAAWVASALGFNATPIAPANALLDAVSFHLVSSSEAPAVAQETAVASCPGGL